jgi:hypothetical protein
LPNRIRRTAITAALTAAAALAPASAHASLVDTSACDGSALSQPFARYGDDNLYKLAPGGDFEGSLSGWSLSSGARVVSGGNGGSAHALQLSSGASAMTAPTCVNAANPSYRFFSHSSGGLLGLLPAMTVSLQYRDSLLGLVALPLGVATPSSSWAPSPVELTLAALPAALADGAVPLSLRFTAIAGTWTIDDVYVDPWSRG